MNPPASGIEALVCADIARRQQLGIAKYGRTVAESPDNMLQHAYEEALDLAVYLKAEIERRPARPPAPAAARWDPKVADAPARAAPPICPGSNPRRTPS